MNKNTNFNELTSKELQTIDGGNPLAVAKTVLEVVGLVASANALYNAYEGARDGYKEEMNKGHGGSGSGSITGRF